MTDNAASDTGAARTHAPGPRRRAFAIVALVCAVAAPALGALLVVSHLLAFVGVLVGAGVVAACAWMALTRRGGARVGAAVLGAVVLTVMALGLLAALRADHVLIVLAVVIGGLAAAAACARRALASDFKLRSGPSEARATTRGSRPVLLMNPRSGGGVVERAGLVAAARERGIDPVVLQPGDDFRAQALQAVAAGADVLGAAGGDGTQAIVATVAVEHGLPFVCIPAGTRNHFALDLGIDRDDVVGALDAFVDGLERRIDLGIVQDRVFVNNVSLGLYGEIVQSPEYRDNKLKTAVAALPDLVGPEGAAPELRFTGPGGAARTTRQLILVSNNPYELTRLGGFGTRARLDTGVLGITSVTAESPTEVAALGTLQAVGQLERFGGFATWTAEEFEVNADTALPVGVDGEFTRLEPPIRFSIRPGALRVRVARHAPGASPAVTAARFDRSTLSTLWDVARGVA